MGPLILEVDDEQSVLLTRSMLLKLSGYRVVDAADGFDGLRQFSSHNPDLVLLDYRMPGMDGGAVALEMRRQRPDVPIIMVSAYVDQPELVRQTVDAFVEKGSGPHVLLQKIAELLRRKRPEAAGVESVDVLTASAVAGTDCGA